MGALALTFCASLGGCNKQGPVEEAIKSTLKDPESAKFGGLTEFSTKDGHDGACIMVNAKNSFGGFEGEKLYYALHDKSTDSWIAEQSPVQNGDCEWYIRNMGFTKR